MGSSVFDEHDERHKSLRKEFHFKTFFAAAPNRILIVEMINDSASAKKGYYLKPSCFSSSEGFWKSIGRSFYNYVKSLPVRVREEDLLSQGSFSIFPEASMRRHFSFKKYCDIGKQFPYNSKSDHLIMTIRFTNKFSDEPSKGIQSLSDFSDLENFSLYLGNWFTQEIEGLVKEEEKDKLEKMYS